MEWRSTVISMRRVGVAAGGSTSALGSGIAGLRRWNHMDRFAFADFICTTTRRGSKTISFVLRNFFKVLMFWNQLLRGLD